MRGVGGRRGGFAVPCDPVQSFFALLSAPHGPKAFEMQTIELDIETERAAHNFVARLTPHFDLAAAVVFGSRARRCHRPDSDADVAVVLRGPRGCFLDTKLAMADIAYDVLLETGVLIQPLPVCEGEWDHPERHSNPGLLQNIHREGVRL